MSAEQYNSATERSSQEQSEWGHYLVGHHHPYFFQQNQHQVQDIYSHHGPLQAATVQSTAAKPAYGNVSTTIDDCTIQSPPSVSAGQDANPSPHISVLSLQSPGKSSVDIVQRLQQRGGGEDRIHPSKAWSAHSTQSKCTKRSGSKRNTNLSTSTLTVRPVGTKDRHSKVRTAKGLRDRRVRLSAPTAIQFFDVQDRLGYDQPSKAVDWLIKKAKAAIDELAPLVEEAATVGGEIGSDRPVQDRQLIRKHDLNSSSARVKDEEQSLAAMTGARAESRAKARERARERAKEKTTTPTPVPSANMNASVETSRSASTSRAPPPPSSPFATSSLQLLPEFPLIPSHFRQQLDELHRPSDLSSMLAPPSALLPFASAFFSTNSAAQSFLIPGDGQHLHYSTPTTYNPITTTGNTTPSSPRGTLQSIFSNPANSSMQAQALMPSPVMVGGPMQAHSYVTTLSSFVEDPSVHHDPHVPLRQSSADLNSNSLQHSRSHIPMRIRGMELGSHVEETGIASSSMQPDYH